MIIDIFNGPTTKKIIRYLNELKPDIVHFHETWGFGSNNYPWPKIFTVHGFDSLNLPTEKPKLWKIRSIMWSIAEKIAMKRQKHIISIAPYVKKEIQPLTSAKIFDIWNPLDIRFFSIERKEKEASLLFLGWINQRKNPGILIEAVQKLVSKYPNLNLILCGEESDKEYSQSLRMRIKELNIENNITFMGNLSQSQVKDQIATASIFILPSLQENAPMVIAENMAAGVPVIASDRCGIPDMLVDNVSGYLIDPNNVETIVSKVDMLLSNDELRLAIGQAGISDARKRYHPEVVVEETFFAYQIAINDQSSEVQ